MLVFGSSDVFKSIFSVSYWTVGENVYQSQICNSHLDNLISLLFSNLLSDVIVVALSIARS